MQRNAFRQNVCTLDLKPEFLMQWPNQTRRKESAEYFSIMLRGGWEFWSNLKVMLSFRGGFFGFVCLFVFNLDS